MKRAVKLSWHTEKRRIKDLVPYEHNPRRLTEKQYAALKESLEKFSLVEIPAINLDGKVVAGHQRLKILAELESPDKIIEVRVPNRKLTAKEFKEYNIRSNKNTGEFDFDILASVFDTEDLINWGFEPGELSIGDGGKTDELMGETFVSFIAGKSEDFAITFQFNKNLKPKFEAYFQAHGKEDLTNKIKEIVLNDNRRKPGRTLRRTRSHG